MSSTPLLALIARCRALCRPRSQAPDAELLARFARQRDAAAFEELLERYAPLVWGICRRIAASEADGEDAFQAVFLALIRQAGRLHGRQPLGGWLHTVAVRVARKAASRTRRQASRTSRAEPSTSGDVADDVASRELFAIVDEEIERLPATLRLPVILCCLQGRTRDEAAEVLGCSVAAVKGRLERGRDLLRRRLEQRGVQLPAALLALSLTGTRIRACLWAKTMQAALYTPAPTIAALAEAALPAWTVGKGKLLVAALLMATSAAGVAGKMLTAKSPQTPAAIPFQAKAAAEPKKPAAPQVRTDHHGDPLPDEAIARLGTVRWRHGWLIQDLVYSPDGKMIAAVGSGRAITLWDAATGKEIHPFPNRSQGMAVAFSPDGKILATTDLTHICYLWDVASGKELRQLKNDTSDLRSVAFAPDGKTLATSGYVGITCIWETNTGKKLRCLDRKQGTAHCVAYSPDGKLLATGGNDGTIRLWNPSTGEERRQLVGHTKQILKLAFSRNGKHLASSSEDGTIRLWEPETGRQVRVFEEKSISSIGQIAFSPNGELLAYNHRDGTIWLRKVKDGAEKRHWQTGERINWVIAFSPDGKTLASGGDWGIIRLWDAATGRERHPSEHAGFFDLLRFSPDGASLVSHGRDRNKLLWWDLATQTPRRQFTWTPKSDCKIAFSADDSTLAASSYVNVEKYLWEVRLWDVRTGKPGRVLIKNQASSGPIAFSPDGRLVAFAGDHNIIYIWDVNNGEEVREITDVTDAVASLCFSPDSKALACNTQQALHLWDLASGKERCSFDMHSSCVSALAFSSDGKVIATGDASRGEDSLVRLWDTATGKEVCRHTGHREGVGAVAFSPNGKLVTSGTGYIGYRGNSVHVWEAATGRLIRRFEGHHSCVSSVAFSPDGLTVASGAGDSTILLWDITGRQKDGKFSPVALTPRQLDSCWTALAHEDAAKAYDAVWSFTAAGEQAVPFLQKHLPPISRPDAKAIARLIADLDSNAFSVRDKATEELSKLSDAAAPALQRALTGKPSLEMRRRLQQLLDQSRDWSAERLRSHRTMQALEHIGTQQAKEVLQALAAGTPQSRRTEEAKAALRRMAR